MLYGMIIKNEPAIAAIILAAGSSRRMGAPKLLLPWGDTTVLGATLTLMAASGIMQRLVVTGAYQDATAAIAADHNVPTAHNPEYAAGEMLSSLQVALRALPPTCAGALVVLGDMPLVRPATIRQIVSAFMDDGGHAIIAPVYNGRQGHPVLFGRALFAALLALPAGAAPRDVVRAHRAQLLQLPVADAGILIDLDDPATYQRWRPG